MATRGRGNTAAASGVDEKTLRKHLSDAHNVQHLLDNPDIQKARKEIRACIVAKWEATKLDDVEGQMYLRMQLHAFDELFRSLEMTMTRAKRAQYTLEKLKDG